jgi:hypothetical protein
MAEPRGPCTGVHPGTFDPIHSHLDIIRRGTLFDVAENVVAVAPLVGAAEPNEPDGGGDPDEAGPDGPARTVPSGHRDPNEPGRDPTQPEPKVRRLNQPELSGRGRNELGGGDPNEPESRGGSGLELRGSASGEPDHG